MASARLMSGRVSESTDTSWDCARPEMRPWSRLEPPVRGGLGKYGVRNNSFMIESPEPMFPSGCPGRHRTVAAPCAHNPSEHAEVVGRHEPEQQGAHGVGDPAHRYEQRQWLLSQPDQEDNHD